MKKIISVLLAAIMVFSAIPLGGLSEYLKNVDFGFISTKASAASTSDLSFELNDDGKSYYVSGCNEEASGSLTIPSTYNGKSVIAIGFFAFCCCSSLTSITIPDSVTSIGDYAFEDCSALTSIKVSSDNKKYSSKDGVLFNKDKTELICCPCGKNGAYKIPDGVTIIGKGAFYGCTGITSVTIPDGVKSIKGNAFSDCSSITSFTIPKSVTEIGAYVFSGTAYYNNSSNWENGALYIGKNLIFVYPDVGKSYTIKAGTKCIASDVFDWCEELETISIPASVTSICENAFYVNVDFYSNNISAIKVSSDNKKYSSKDGVLFNKNKTKLICCPGGKSGSYTIPDSVTSIADCGFLWCYKLKSIVINNSEMKIGKSAFFGCNKATIYGKSGSTAQTYAKENNIPFKKILSSSVKVKLGEISNTSTGVKITWSGLSGAEKYTIYRKSGTSSYKAIKTVSSSKKSYTDTTAKSGTKYTYTVKATNAVSKSGYDKTGLSKLYLATPTVKTSNTSKGISVKWNKITGAKGYYVYRKAGSGSWTKVKDVTSGSTVSFTDKNVKSGTKYCYKVKAYNGKTYSGGKSSDVLMYLKAVTLSSASSGKTGITVKWESVSSAKGYYVYCQTGSGSFKKIATVTGGSTVKYLDKSAEKDTTYTYYVKAYNGSYKGSYANKLSCKDKY